MTTETQQQAPIQDIDYVTHKPYSQKRLACIRSKKHEVSTPTFYGDLQIFDPEMKAKYGAKQVSVVLHLIFKKVAERIIKNLWRMPLPNGMGSMYMAQRQLSSMGIKTGGKIDRPVQLNKLLLEVRLGMKSVFLKWNKDGRNFSYKDIWRVRASRGYFTDIKLAEVNKRAEDQTLKVYRGHIM